MQYTTTTLLALGLATIAAASPRPYPIPRPYPEPAAVGDACAVSGVMRCTGRNTWSLCDHGVLKDMGKTAAGMACIENKDGTASMVHEESVTDAFALDAAQKAAAVQQTIQALMDGTLDWGVENFLMSGEGLEVALISEDMRNPDDIVLDGDAPIDGSPVELPSTEQSGEPAPEPSASAPAENLDPEGEGVDGNSENVVETPVDGGVPVTETSPSPAPVEEVPVEEAPVEEAPVVEASPSASPVFVESVQPPVEDTTVVQTEEGTPVVNEEPVPTGHWDPITGLWVEPTPVVRRRSNKKPAVMVPISKRAPVEKRAIKGCIRFWIERRGPYLKC